MESPSISEFFLFLFIFIEVAPCQMYFFQKKSASTLKLKNAALAKILDFIEFLPHRGFTGIQELSTFRNLSLVISKPKREPTVAGLIPIISPNFLTIGKNEEVMNFLFKINQNWQK